MVRARAIGYAIFFAFVPCRFYEPTPHYAMSYSEHLRLNLRYAWRWATWREDETDWAFEETVNGNA